MRKLAPAAAIAGLTIPAHAKISISHVKACEGLVTADDNPNHVQIGENNTGTFCMVNGAVAGNANMETILASAHVRFKAMVDRHDHAAFLWGEGLFIVGSGAIMEWWASA